MAPLKLRPNQNIFITIFSFHDWKVMAPLKLHTPFFYSPFFLLFPWLKSHGSIEAVAPLIWPLWNSHVSMTEKSWLHWSFMISKKIMIIGVVSMTEKSWLHWSHYCSTFVVNEYMFPWLKSHGSIEAEVGLRESINLSTVSMTEKSWLHWST